MHPISSSIFSSFVNSHAQWSLTPITEVLQALGNPQARLAPVIHVTGTNGKGSSVAFLKAILQSQGLGVQVYTSPHLVSVCERITLVGGPVSLEALEETLTLCLRCQKTPLSFFEALTASAFWLFSQEEADVVIVEVGLGGRLDATNVVETTCSSLITSISLDHTELLGKTTRAIAQEKAAIMRRKVPCITVPQDSEAIEALQTYADAIGSPLFVCGRDWSYHAWGEGVCVEGPWGKLEIDHIKLRGAHQKTNGAGVVASLLYQKVLDISHEAMIQGLSSAVWRGRLERYSLRRFPEQSEIWIDGAHNPAGVEVLSQYIRHNWKEPFILVLGVLARKDPRPFLEKLIPLADEVWVVENFGREPALSAAAFEKNGVKMRSFKSWQDLRTHHGLDGPKKMLMTGSLYFIGEIFQAEEADV